MRKTGPIIAIIAGIFGVLAAVLTLALGAVGNFFRLENASLVVWFGWGGLVFSFATIILGAMCINARSRIPALLLVMSAIAGCVLGGTYVAVFMGVAVIGGMLALFSGNPAAARSSASPKTSSASSEPYELEFDPDKADEIIARYVQQKAQAARPATTTPLPTPRAPAVAGFGKRRS